MCCGNSIQYLQFIMSQNLIRHFLRTSTTPRKSPRKQIGVDKLVLFQAANKIVDRDPIFEQNSPENFTFKRLDNSVQLFIKCNEARNWYSHSSRMY